MPRAERTPPRGGEDVGPSFYGLPWERYVGIFNSVGLVPGRFWLSLVVVTELIGGICIFFGLLTRFWAAGLAIALTMSLMGPSLLSVDRAIGLEKPAA